MHRLVFRQIWWTVLILCGLVGVTGCQPAEEKMITIGVVSGSTAMQDAYDGFRERMTQLGYKEGENITYVFPDPGKDQDELNLIAEELVAESVDLILAMTTPAAQAAKTATAESKTPVVFVPVTDPVGAQLVNELSEPGGNLTGVTNLSSENLRLDWLQKIASPAKDFKLVYVPYNSKDKSANYAFTIATEAASALGLKLIAEEATDVEKMREVLKNMPEEMDAIFMLPDRVSISVIDEFVSTAKSRQIPLCAPTTTQVKQGALLSYGLDLFSAGGQAARLADQILRGKWAGSLPVEESDFFLAINLETAEAIDYTISDSILNQADLIYP